MSKFLIIGGIIVLSGTIIGLGFGKDYGMWIAVGGTLIALLSLLFGY